MVSEVVNYKIFLGEQAPRPPYFCVLMHAVCSIFCFKDGRTTCKVLPPGLR